MNKVSGRGLQAHVDNLAKKLGLTSTQAHLLADEVRNALTPVTLLVSTIEKGEPKEETLTNLAAVSKRSIARLIALSYAVEAKAG